MQKLFKRAGRIGILGGTFNPVHHGHLIVAEAACRALKLDRLVFLPAARPPHKGTAGLADAAARLRMLRLAVRGNPRFAVLDLELRRGGTSYTVDTLRHLAALSKKKSPCCTF
jgi:nicotinate-nucleotide adenylyltransferase